MAMNFLITFLLLVKLVNGFVPSDNYIKEDSYENRFEDFYDDNDGDDEIFEDIYEMIEQLKFPDDNSPLGMAFQTTDAKCIESEYDKNDLLHLIPNLGESLRETNFDDVALFTNFVIMCSSIKDEVLEVKFNQLISDRGPLAIIRNDPLFLDFAGNLECFKMYAVRQNLLNSSVYNINETQFEQYDDNCLITVETFRHGFTIDTNHHLSHDRSQCLEKGISFDKSTLKYLLLIQLELTVEQRSNERKQYIEDVHRDHEKMLTCMRNKR